MNNDTVRISQPMEAAIMNTATRSRVSIPSMALIASMVILSVSCASAQSTDGPQPSVIFLVRHAEKADKNDDPDLTDDGRQRATTLASVLRDAKIEHIHSTDFRRTRNTAAPTAAQAGVEMKLYDPRDLAALVDAIQRRGGRHLVVGHSNTTPQVVEMLGGDPVDEIDEASEYDRLYVVTIGDDGSTSSVLFRYGRPHEPVDQ